MKPYLAAIMVLLLLHSPMPAEEPEAIVKESLKLTSDLLNILKTIKDKPSAEAAATKLKALDERLAVLKRKEVEASKLSSEEQKQLQAKNNEVIKQTTKALTLEFERIDKLPEVKAVLLKDSTLFEQTYKTMALMRTAMVNAAKIQIRMIDQAVAVYYVKNNEYPAQLKLLTEGDKRQLEAAALTDPWHQPYQYDPAGTRNKGRKPDVWTTTPDQKVIGNWPEEKK